MRLTKEEMVAAFTLWDTEYRKNPEKFMNTVEHLLRSTPDEYGDSAAVCFEAYVRRIRENNKDK